MFGEAQEHGRSGRGNGALGYIIGGCLFLWVLCILAQTRDQKKEGVNFYGIVFAPFLLLCLCNDNNSPFSLLALAELNGERAIKYELLHFLPQSIISSYEDTDSFVRPKQRQSGTKSKGSNNIWPHYPKLNPVTWSEQYSENVPAAEDRVWHWSHHPFMHFSSPTKAPRTNTDCSVLSRS